MTNAIIFSQVYFILLFLISTDAGRKRLHFVGRAEAPHDDARREAQRRGGRAGTAVTNIRLVIQFQNLSNIQVNPTS